MFGLPCSTTCDEFKPHKNLKPGYNQDIIDHAVELYNGGPVIDASDEARALRFVMIESQMPFKISFLCLEIN